MFTFFYFTSCSILLLVAELLLRSAGLTVPLLGFFFAAASVAVSSRMAFFFALVFGVMLDFTAGYAAPWSGLLLPLLGILSNFGMFLWRPVNDDWYYVSVVFSILMIILSYLLIVNMQNRETQRDIPVFTGKRGETSEQ